MIDMFSLAQLNILQHHKVSLECITWIIVYTAFKNKKTREQLSSIDDIDDWIAVISYENNDNDKSCIRSFIREWYSPTCEDYTLHRRKFYLLLK